jgi:hypothetical protein
MKALLRKLLRRRRFATGGVILSRRPDDDSIPAFLSPGRSTHIRPGETHPEAMERLIEGEDLWRSPRCPDG